MPDPNRQSEKTELIARGITRWATRFAHGISAHWLLMANLALVLVVGLPFVPPILAQTDNTRGAQLFYRFFQPWCHQIPERSFFLFGQQWTYSYDQLSHLLAGATVPQRWMGLSGIGFKVAVCERDVAIYASMLLAGLGFNLVRRRLMPLRAKAFGLLILPMAVDGTGQLVGLWNSTWVSRVVTGSLFGIALIWLAFPYVERGMREVREETEKTILEQKL